MSCGTCSNYSMVPFKACLTIQTVVASQFALQCAINTSESRIWNWLSSEHEQHKTSVMVRAQKKNTIKWPKSHQFIYQDYKAMHTANLLQGGLSNPTPHTVASEVVLTILPLPNRYKKLYNQPAYWLWLAYFCHLQLDQDSTHFIGVA